MPSELEGLIRFDQLRYAQCWEDADILLEALEVRPHHTCLSIASGGENTLALLSRGPQKVIAVDLSPAQIACLELKAAAFAQLSHPEMLVLLGSWDALAGDDLLPRSRDSQRTPGSLSTVARLRQHLYARCRQEISPAARQFWDERTDAIASGINHSGRFERYLALFRRWILPLTHPQADWRPVLFGLTPAEREIWYQTCWNTWRWRSLFRVFFSRFTLGHLGTDPQFLRYGDRSLAAHLLQRTRYALTTLDPAQNPYLQWIVLGRHYQALPYALRPHHFAAIRDNLHRLEWRTTSLEDFIASNPIPIDRFNLSNVFEYMSPVHYAAILRQLHRVAAPNARLAFWNRLSDRTCSQTQTPAWKSMVDVAERLHQQDQVFFYKRFVVAQPVNNSERHWVLRPKASVRG